MDPSIIATAAGTVTLVAGVGARPLGRWVRKVKRRRGGVYLWRVDHHRNRARRVTGYVGETVSFKLRSAQHLGRDMGIHGGVKQAGQAWSDLRPRMYRVIPLPWWLCWKWVLRPLETLVIMCTWPVYNDAKNRWNPRRIPKHVARLERSMRDGHGAVWTVRTAAAHGLRRAFIALSLLVLVLGAVTVGIYR